MRFENESVTNVEVNIRERTSRQFDISPDSGPDLINFATIVYLFLPHPASLFPGPEGENSDRAADSGWRIAIPGRKEYRALCLLLHPDRNPEIGGAWMQKLGAEWEEWEKLGAEDKSVKTMEELARAFVREKQRAEALRCFAPTSIRERISKWESRIRELRDTHKTITLDELDSLLAEDIHKLFPDLVEESSVEGDLDIDEFFGADG